MTQQTIKGREILWIVKRGLFPSLQSASATGFLIINLLLFVSADDIRKGWKLFVNYIKKVCDYDRKNNQTTFLPDAPAVYFSSFFLIFIKMKL